MVVVPFIVGGWWPVVFLCPPPRESRECARVVGGRDVLSGGSLCVLGARAVGSVGWGSPVGWRGSVVVLEPSISEVGSSACTPLLSKHRALSPGQVGSHTNVEGVYHLLSTVSLLQYGELVLAAICAVVLRWGGDGCSCRSWALCGVHAQRRLQTRFCCSNKSGSGFEPPC